MRQDPKGMPWGRVIRVWESIILLFAIKSQDEFWQISNILWIVIVTYKIWAYSGSPSLGIEFIPSLVSIESLTYAFSIETSHKKVFVDSDVNKAFVLGFGSNVNLNK